MRAATRLRTPHGVIAAERFINGVPINPRLPERFDATPNEDRPASHLKFWHRPYIVTDTVEALDAIYAGRTDPYAEEARQHWIDGRKQWLAAWPTGTRYTVRCLDGGAWDRSTNWGCFSTLEAALVVAGGEH